MHPLNGEPLQLEEHLKQLKILYEEIEKKHVYYETDFADGITSILDALRKVTIPGKRVVEPNPLYPDESYEQFVSRIITEKKKKIERVLDLY